VLTASGNALFLVDACGFVVARLFLRKSRRQNTLPWKFKVAARQRQSDGLGVRIIFLATVHLSRGEGEGGRLTCPGGARYTNQPLTRVPTVDMPFQTPQAVAMIAELQNYRGVSCLRCGEPIPVSAKIMEIQDETARGRMGVPYVFLARCKLCEYETVYEAGKVQTFDGQPRKRSTRVRSDFRRFNLPITPGKVQEYLEEKLGA
jgi:hypothetical protein